MLRWIDIIKYATYGNPEPTRRAEKTEQEWRQLLTPEQYEVTRQKGTEKPYKNAYCRSFEPGRYICVCCGQLLFNASNQFKALASGWPSFTQPASKAAIKYVFDNSHNMKRVEVVCNVCDSHLGHVFNDGPEAPGLRYCVNSTSMVKQEV